ncbi:MAG: tetratricopeptide repeat protein [Thermogemmata sp.]|jgi:tetratricopeptide (TPR) repeat protein
MAVTCSRCGNQYSGYECPFCKVKEATEKLSTDLKTARKDITDAAESTLREAQTLKEKLQEELSEFQERMRSELEEQIWAQEEVARRIRHSISHAQELQAKTLLDKAVRLRNSELFSDALQIAEQGIALDPENIDARRETGYICYRLRQYDKARKHLEAALRLDKDYLPAYRILSWVARESGRLEEAKEFFRRAVGCLTCGRC